MHETVFCQLLSLLPQCSIKKPWPTGRGFLKANKWIVIALAVVVLLRLLLYLLTRKP